ncbi:hypothetical protein Q0Z83_029080 [Actinoplanes sichuanensis]|nr:hypothetical protein Q0Z83_029080 [Actinoplanes sichuanensis]
MLRRGGPDRFDREARTIAGLTHPNIVAVHDVGADDGVRYLVMELVHGRSLADRLHGGPLEVTEAIRIAIGVCAALEAAAGAGIVHRDVKPANILFDRAGRVKVCDFGIAGLAGADSAPMVGTSAYMAPEQVTGSVVDARTDLYGLGCVLYDMLAGRPPYVDGDTEQVAWQHVERTPQAICALRPDVPPALDRLTRTLLAKYPADRPDSPALVRVALERLSTPHRATGRRWHRPVIITVAAAVALVGVVSSSPEPPGTTPRAVPPVAPSRPAPVTSPAPAPRPTSQAHPPPRPDPLGVIDSLPAKQARQLRRKLADLDSGRGGANRLAVKTAALRADLAELHRDGLLTDAGYATLLQRLV